jgi:long-chain acyl-CoA synthetase
MISVRVRMDRAGSTSSADFGITESLLRAIVEGPHRTALVTDQGRWTYGQIDRLVAAAVQRMNEAGLPHSGRVAIVGKNHSAYVFAMYAAFCRGMSTVEVSHREPLETLLSVLKSTSPALVVTDRADLALALEGQVPVDTFETYLQAIELGAACVGSLAAATGHADRGEASIVYTSGTTGPPKGVILSHGNWRFVVESIVAYLGMTAMDRYGVVLPFTHTYGKSNLLTTFAVGGTAVLLDEFPNIPGFLDRLSGERCTVLSLVPYHANVLLKRGNLSRRDLSSLRAITFSGNSLPSATLAGVRDVLPTARVFSMYGLTESTTRACYVPPDRIMDKPGSCGRPLPGVEIRIQRDDGHTSEPGHVGEVFLRGPNIMQGYFGDPDLTAETLREGWLRTGDLGRLDEEGYLFLEGRKKDIVKCAGQRISPAEIEAVLATFPGVAEAAVVGVPDALLGESIAAFLVVTKEFPGESELRVHCARNLSHHKIPRQYRFVASLPKTATGKVRKHLFREDPSDGQ